MAEDMCPQAQVFKGRLERGSLKVNFTPSLFLLKETNQPRGRHCGKGEGEAEQR